MKERPLNFDYADETPVEVDETKREKLEKAIKKLHEHTGMLMYLIKGNALQVGTRDSIMAILDRNVQEICDLFDYNTYLKSQQEKTLQEIREANIENHELRRQLGQKVTMEDCRESVKNLISGFRYWGENYGFGWVSDIEINDYGTLSGRMRTHISSISRKPSEIWKRVLDFGFEFEEKDINKEDVYPIANDHNIELMRKLVKTLDKDAIAERITINRRGDIPHIEDMKIILPTWDCLTPYIEANLEEEKKLYRK